MALEWTNFNNGDSGLEVRNKINSFNNDVVTNYQALADAIKDNRLRLTTL